MNLAGYGCVHVCVLGKGTYAHHATCHRFITDHDKHMEWEGEADRCQLCCITREPTEKCIVPALSAARQTDTAGDWVSKA